MSDELISIIVPCYNVERYLDKCIKSIINQTISNIEIILVNDGSTDNTGKICTCYAKLDKRIKVINKENGGISSARNSGIAVASGKYIGFVDSDDYIEPNMYEILYKNLVKYNVDIAQCSYNVFCGNNIIPIKKSNHKKIFNNEEGVKNILEADIFFPSVWNKLYKRSIVDIYFRTYNISEDRVFNIEVFKNAKSSIYLDDCKYNYVQNENSLVNSAYSKKNIDVLLGFRYITGFITSNYPYLEKHALKNEIVESFVQIGSIYYLKKQNQFKKELNSILSRLEEIEMNYPKVDILDKKYQWLLKIIHINKKVFLLVLNILFKLRGGVS